MLLDIVEVARSHTGLNLALAFAEIIHDFGIEHKVCQLNLPTPPRIHQHFILNTDAERCL